MQLFKDESGWGQVPQPIFNALNWSLHFMTMNNHECPIK